MGLCKVENGIFGWRKTQEKMMNDVEDLKFKGNRITGVSLMSAIIILLFNMKIYRFWSGKNGLFSS